MSILGCIPLSIKGRLLALWVYRDFVSGSVKREFQSKYQNSMLGAAWTVINPLAMILVYTVIFSQLMQTKLPGVIHGFAYSIYLCSGILTWGLFAEIVSRGQNIFIDNANLIKKINFPRLSLPIIMVIGALLNFWIIFGLFLATLLILGQWPGWPVLGMVPVLIVQLVFSIGLGVSIGVLNVFFRDIGQFFGIALQFWFWLTPIVYPITVLPNQIKAVMSINPMYPLIAAYQGILTFGYWPDWSTLIYPLLLGVGLCFVGLRMFQQHSGEMVDEL